jgi:hypothetical protein
MIFILAFHLWAFPAYEMPIERFFAPPLWLVPVYLEDA